MEGTDPRNTLFLCSVCGKGSASDAANKRHIRYCRRKSAIGAKSRAKSCQTCITAKTRCELDFTGCERCTQKGIACSLYPGLPPLSGDGDALLPVHDFATDISHSQVPSQAGLPLDLGNGGFPWQLLGDPVNDAASIGMNDLSDSPLQLFGQVGFYTPSTMMASTIGYGILRSYPSLMQDKNNLPPFIHPCCYGSEEDGWALPKALARVVAITSGSFRDDTLSKIRQEQHRISDELFDMGIEDLLSSLQAIIIYILIRLTDGPSVDQEDVHLSQTLTHLCGRIPSLPDFDAQVAGFTPWKRWTIIESKRRINSVVRLMCQLYNLDAGLPHPCHRTAWTSSPLPASKLLWKASTEADWEAVRANDSFYRNLSNQDLLYFKGCTEVDGQPSKEEWVRWYAGADELGILVVINTSLT